MINRDLSIMIRRRAESLLRTAENRAFNDRADGMGTVTGKTLDQYNAAL